MADLLSAQLAAGMAALRGVQDRLMPDTCRITRPADAGQTPALDGNGDPILPAATVVYEGPCAVANPVLPIAPLSSRTVQDQAGAPEQRTLRTPHTADARTGDLVEMTSCAFSPGLVGDVFAIVREDERTFAVYRSYIMRGSSWQGGQ